MKIQPTVLFHTMLIQHKIMFDCQLETENEMVWYTEVTN